MKTTTRIALPKPKHKKPFNKKEFVKQANEVKKILEKEKNTGTGAYDATTRAGKKRFRDMLRELQELLRQEKERRAHQKTEEIRKRVFLSRAGW